MTTTAGSDGSITVALPIPAGQAVGPVTVTATGAVSNTPATTSVTVEATTYVTAITATPATVDAGTSTTITGTGFAPSETVTVSIPGADPVTTTSTAEGTISVALPVPADYASTTAVVTATGAVSDTPATTNLAVNIVYNTAITVDPTTVVPGTSTVVTGTGYAPNETVTVSIPGASPVTVQTNETGGFTVSLPIPADYVPGPVTVTAVGNVSDTPAETDITVVYTTAITVTPTTTGPGTTLQVSGSGFAPGETVTVSVPDGTPVTATANETGGFVVDLPLASNQPAGPVTVTATGSISNTPAEGNATVVYTTAIVATPASVNPGETTQISGAGFAPGETVSVSIPDLPAVTAVVGADGTFTVPLPIPSDYPDGTVTVTASGPVSAAPATAGLAIQSIVYVTAITATPATVDAGTSTTITGTGFAPSETVTVSIPDADPVTTTSTAEGTISVALPIPADYASTTAVVTATGAVSNTPATTNLAVNIVYTTAITVDPTTVTPGTSTVVTGTGYAPNETVTVSIPGAPPVTVQTNETGGFTVSLPIPADYVPGPVTVTAVGAVSDTPAETDITVVYTTAITATPGTVNPGGTTTIAGTGFAPNEAVTISAPGVTSVTTQSSATGTISAPISI
ncbi:beta strand repeat-containing protein, partial [Plantibacter sp. YIM 135347]|uniref:beta strand repeat-containing protein n=1 Tax=Plantibacter sp. YIM 135347 TaxID=3423919 RepID=UPI003D32A043